MEHTPGKWNVQRRAHGGINGAAIVADNGLVVARVPHAADRPIEQKVADANLLAAAPAMLEALVSTTNWLKDFQNSQTASRSEWEEIDRSVEQANAAISLATKGEK